MQRKQLCTQKEKSQQEGAASKVVALIKVATAGACPIKRGRVTGLTRDKIHRRLGDRQLVVEARDRWLAIEMSPSLPWWLSEPMVTGSPGKRR